MGPKWRLVAVVVCVWTMPETIVAQNFTPQLRADPDIGNVLGVQRFGRPLRSDPDQGEGFTYRVFPVGYGPATYGGGQTFIPNPQPTALATAPATTPLQVPP